MGRNPLQQKTMCPFPLCLVNGLTAASIRMGGGKRGNLSEEQLDR